ncbi:MAG TPA: metallophosphoesterase, partial [Methanobacteriaceae archaeon]|nr:metallophosphoesterase [Methanobacteriaceae archaeon]
YTPSDFPELIIEHGHRYNFYCAPDYSNQSVTQTDSILPPGYFFTRMATSSVIQGRPKLDVTFPDVQKNDLGEVQFLYFL